MNRLLIALLCLAIAVPAAAQVTTSTLRGTVKSADDGTTIAEATVTLTHEPSGSLMTTTTNGDGVFVFTDQRVGGPYRVRAEFPGFKDAIATGVYLSAGKTRDVTLSVRLAEEVIEVEGTSVTRNTSGRTVITSAEINSLPSVSRDPRDIVRRSPEAVVEGRDKALSVGGNNTRFNSVTVDGVRQDDDFGLNQSGYPTRRSPIALSAIEEIAVETSPFDVRYGRFLGGNVNIVTKSGSNEFHGQALLTYASDKLVSSESREDDVDFDFREYRFGATVGGPIIKDKLHFLASVEGLDASTPVDVGPAGSGRTISVSRVSAGDLAEVQRIAREIYNFNAGEASRNLDERDLKLLGKIDWTVSKQHRVSATYQRTAGNAIQNTTSSDTTLALSSNWYDARDTLHTFSGRLFSTWSDALSTQVELSGKFVESRVPPLEGNGFMAASIRTADGGTILLGPDEFRHRNELDNNTLHGKVEANYLLGKQLFTGGLEVERLAIRNLFVATSNGAALYPSVEAFAMQMPTSISYSNAVSLNADDAAANFDTSTITAYVQDQIKLTPELTLQGGVRFEYYLAEDDIRENPNFVDRYGFSNTETLGGRYLVMPRLGLSYLPMENLNLRAGGGLYSGGTPSVWISNSYNNDGVAIGTAFSNSAAVVGGFNGRDIPQALLDTVAGGNGNVDAVDPDFELPSVWKVGGGADYSIEGIELKLNYVYSKTRDGVIWSDLRRNSDAFPNNQPIGVLPDGRPLYDFDNSDGSQFNSRRGFDMLLRNTDEGYGHVASLSAQKGFDFGLFLFGSYAYQNVKELSPANSSRSVSNYGLSAVVDPEAPPLAVSNYERQHRFTAAIEYSHPIISHFAPCAPWKNMKTSVGLFIESRSGQPYSWTFADSTFGDGAARIFGEDREFARRNRELFYVPKGDGSDVILNGIDQATFDAFLSETGLDKYRGKIAPRNAFHSSWFSKWDLRLSQDLPNPVAKHRAQVVLDIENLGNLINHDWGRVTSVPFPYTTPAVDVSVDAATGKYVYSNLRRPNANRVDIFQSVWRASIGIIYDF